MKRIVSRLINAKLLSAALLGSVAFVASPASAGTSFQADVGAWTTLNPGYVEDQQYGSQGTVTSSVTLDDGVQLGFTGPVTIFDAGSGWATWCCSYTGQVLWTGGGTSLTIDTLPDVYSFGFYAEPDQYADFLITLLMTDGSTLTRTVNGNGGAEFFGFTGAGVSSMTISSTTDFAIGDFFVVPGGVPEPSTWAMMLLGFGGIGFAMRRTRKPTLAQLA